jgi:hypothetical protein
MFECASACRTLHEKRVATVDARENRCVQRWVAHSKWRAWVGVDVLVVAVKEDPGRLGGFIWRECPHARPPTFPLTLVQQR